MTPTVVKAADAAHFLSVVPRMLGYLPRSSLVVIPFHSTRSLGAMRFDLPADAHSVDPVAATVIGMVCRLPDADAVAAITYTDARFDGEERMPHRDLLDALARRAHTCGLHVTDLLCVAADAWGSSLDPDCPAAGRSLDQLERYEAIADQPRPEGDQDSGAELPPVSADERERVADAVEAIGIAVGVLCGPDTDGRTGTAGRTSRSARGTCAETSADGTTTDAAEHEPRHSEGAATTHAADLGPVPAPAGWEAEDDAEHAGPEARGTAPTAPRGCTGTRNDGSPRLDPRALSAVCRLDDLPGFFEEAIAQNRESRDPYDTAALIWCLARPSLRDVALVQWSGNLAQGDEALDAQLRWESGEEYPAHLAMRMWGEGDVPQVSRLERALELSRYAAALAPEETQPGALAMCAWLSWALGRSTHAAAYAERACVIEPEHGLSQIVLSFVHAGHLPDWAFRRAGRR